MPRLSCEIQGLGLVFGCHLPGASRRIKRLAKHVESSGVPCLDAGSTPATSTFTARSNAGRFCFGLVFGCRAVCFGRGEQPFGCKVC